MAKLIVIPTESECEIFLTKCNELGHPFAVVQYGILACHESSELQIIVAQGGLGKAQFGVQTQYLLDRIDGVDAVLCVGASGSLSSDCAIGDVIVGTKTVEHDVRHHNRRKMPEFQSDVAITNSFRSLPPKERTFAVRFGPVASGDEDIMNSDRKAELRNQTDAIAVAWEGAGCARACYFNNVPFGEIRAITDFANHRAHEDFHEHLEMAVGNLAKLIVDYLEIGKDN